MSAMAEPLRHFEIIRAAATHVRSGGLDAIKTYIEAITASAFPASPLRQVLEAKLATLQYRFQRGAIEPISEDRLVDALNRIADEAELPDYGKTNRLEFRIFHMIVLTSVPQLREQGLQIPEDGTAPADPFRPEVSLNMSPAEALYLVASLVRQKLLNPQFQLNEVEFTTRYTQVGARPRESRSSEYSLIAMDLSDRGSVIRKKLQAYARRCSSVRQASDAINSFLKQLGYDTSDLPSSA